MDEKTKAALRDAGLDTDTAINRFMGNENMYEKFLVKFINDKNFDAISSAMDNQDWDSMFAALHTLKGVSGNLEMTHLFQACSDAVCYFRNNDNKNLQEVQALYGHIQTAYNQVIDVIKKEWDYD